MSNSVNRALQVLELLAASEKPLSLARVSEQLDMPKSTAHGIVKSLAERRFLHATSTGAYVIGIKAFEVGTAYVRDVGSTAIIAPELVSVTRLLEVTCHYAVLDGSDAVYLIKEDPPRTGVQLASSLGARLPSHLTAVGKACLAWLPADEVPGHVQLDGPERSRRSLLGALALELDGVREAGFSTDDGVTAAGIRCVAAPVFDVEGPCGAIGVSYLRDAGSSSETVVDAVVAAARRATELLGGKARR